MSKPISISMRRQRELWRWQRRGSRDLHQLFWSKPIWMHLAGKRGDFWNWQGRQGNAPKCWINCVELCEFGRLHWVVKVAWVVFSCMSYVCCFQSQWYCNRDPIRTVLTLWHSAGWKSKRGDVADSYWLQHKEILLELTSCKDSNDDHV